MALVADLAPFGRLDLVPLDDGRWEVRIVENLRTPMPVVLRAVEAWLEVWNAQETTVHIAGKPRRMRAREAGTRNAPTV